VRKDHRPRSVKNLFAALNRFYAERFLHPNFDYIGRGSRIINPRYVEISGPRIKLREDIHMMATRDSHIRFQVLSNSAQMGEIEIGKYSIILPGTRIVSRNSIRIGKNCMVAMRGTIMDADLPNSYDRTDRYAHIPSAPIRIEDNVWIGDSALICKGVRIGRNSIIGTRAVVVDDIPANVVAAGNPAVVVKELDPSQHFSSREDLFTGPISYADMEEDYDRQVLAGNTIFRWLRLLLWPTNEF